MRRSKFWIFLLFVISGLLFLPKAILNVDMSQLSSINIPFLGITPNYTPEEAYDLIYEGMLDLRDEVKLSTNLTSDEIFDIRDRVIADHPEFFYLDYENSKYWSNGKLDFRYIDSKENIRTKSQRIETKSSYILAKIIKPEMTEFEKELAIHDFLVINTRYDEKNLAKNTLPPSAYNVDGIILDGLGVCEGYAQAFKLLLNKVGIEAVVVSEPRINHAWNIVKIDGEYYHVDATWNDPVPDVRGRALHTFFNVSDRKMLQGKHVWDQEKYPACTSEKYAHMWGS